MPGTAGTPTDSSGSPDSPGAERCPCGTGDAYGACCGRYHRGEADAPTAEALMRSRYTAFARRDVAYLLRTWHPDDRPDEAEVDLDPDQRWVRLDVVETTGGGPFDDEGTVTFEARWRSTASRDGGTPTRGVLRERSRFVRSASEVPGAARRWLYLDGELA